MGGGQVLLKKKNNTFILDVELTVVMLEKIREDGFAKSTQNQYVRQLAFLSPQ
jgi:hypothetical protein